MAYAVPEHDGKNPVDQDCRASFTRWVSRRGVATGIVLLGDHVSASFGVAGGSLAQPSIDFVPAIENHPRYFNDASERSADVAPRAAR